MIRMLSGKRNRFENFKKLSLKKSSGQILRKKVHKLNFKRKIYKKFNKIPEYAEAVCSGIAWWGGAWCIGWCCIGWRAWWGICGGQWKRAKLRRAAVMRRAVRCSSSIWLARLSGPVEINIGVGAMFWAIWAAWELKWVICGIWCSSDSKCSAWEAFCRGKFPFYNSQVNKVHFWASKMTM